MAQELFVEAFRLSPAAMGIVRFRDGIVIDVNEAAVVLAGRTREEMVGRTTVSWGMWLDPSVRQRMYADLAAHRQVRDLTARLVRELLDQTVTARS